MEQIKELKVKAFDIRDEIDRLDVTIDQIEKQKKQLIEKYNKVIAEMKQLRDEKTIKKETNNEKVCENHTKVIKKYNK